MNIWHLANKDLTNLMLWRTDNNTFRVIQAGDYKPLLTNIDYILIDKKYTDVLRQYPSQVSLQEVRIYDYNRKTQADSYIELKIQNPITPFSIETLNNKEIKIWIYDSHIFVSESLKTELSQISNDDFVFSFGFSHFG